MTLADALSPSAGAVLHLPATSTHVYAYSDGIAFVHESGGSCVKARVRDLKPALSRAAKFRWWVSFRPTGGGNWQPLGGGRASRWLAFALGGLDVVASRLMNVGAEITTSVHPVVLELRRIDSARSALPSRAVDSLDGSAVRAGRAAEAASERAPTTERERSTFSAPSSRSSVQGERPARTIEGITARQERFLDAAATLETLGVEVCLYALASAGGAAKWCSTEEVALELGRTRMTPCSRASRSSPAGSSRRSTRAGRDTLPIFPLTESGRAVLGLNERGEQITQDVEDGRP